jgi:hypothetical protein
MILLPSQGHPNLTAPRHDLMPGNFLCATHVECLGGESPLWAVMSGTVRLSKGVGREAESEGSEG